EADVLAPRPAARARRAAVDARRSNGVDEQPVRTTVVLDDGVPSREVVQLFADVLFAYVLFAYVLFAYVGHGFSRAEVCFDSAGVSYVVSGFSRTRFSRHRIHAPSIAPLVRSHHPV